MGAEGSSVNQNLHALSLTVDRGRSPRRRSPSGKRRDTRSPRSHSRMRDDRRDRQNSSSVEVPQADFGNHQQLDAEVHARNLIREAERNKARAANLPGNTQQLILPTFVNSNQAMLHSVMVDESYLLVAAHVDEQLKRKVLQFKFVDFFRLLPHDRILQQEDQRLTFVNKGGIPYLVPMNDNPASINSYGKWDQAFRVYSDIVTTQYPNKAHELIQYNHVIHTASQTYLWDNVYMYD